MRPRGVMVDLETLGTAPGSIILSIGAVSFGPKKEHGSTFYEKISIESCQEHGLTFDADTLSWWMIQSAQARAEAFSGALPLPVVLQSFIHFIGRDAKDVEIWGNGASFDITLLAAAYRATKLPCPWKFWNERCYRTMKSLYPEVPCERIGTHHNALDDAMTQALHLAQILMHIEKAGAPLMEVKP